MSNLPKVTQPAGGLAGIETQQVVFRQVLPPLAEFLDH